MIGLFFNTGITALLFGATLPKEGKTAEEKMAEGVASVTNASTNEPQEDKEEEELASLEHTQ